MDLTFFVGWVQVKLVNSTNKAFDRYFKFETEDVRDIYKKANVKEEKKEKGEVINLGKKIRSK